MKYYCIFLFQYTHPGEGDVGVGVQSGATGTVEREKLPNCLIVGNGMQGNRKPNLTYFKPEYGNRSSSETSETLAISTRCTYPRAERISTTNHREALKLVVT
jgi:hypothetical protein